MSLILDILRSFINLHVFSVIALGLFLVFLVIFMIWNLWVMLREWQSDHSLLIEKCRRFNSHRTEIAQSFQLFKTKRARLKYARWIESEAHAPEDLDALYDLVSNPWPDGHRPNIDNDAGSTLLAKLDERWLKLDV